VSRRHPTEVPATLVGNGKLVVFSGSGRSLFRPDTKDVVI